MSNGSFVPVIAVKVIGSDGRGRILLREVIVTEIGQIGDRDVRIVEMLKDLQVHETLGRRGSVHFDVLKGKIGQLERAALSKKF